MAVLANDQSKDPAKKLALRTISSLGDAKHHFSPEFIAQQRKMAADWSVNLSSPKEKARLAALARRVRDSGDKWTDAKKAAMQEFLEAVRNQAGMPKEIEITIGRTDDPKAMAATTGKGLIIFNENNKSVWSGEVDQLITTLFHEAGHAWNYTLSDKYAPERDRNALMRPRFQDGEVDQSLYESNPDEVHSRLIQKFARAIAPSGNSRNGKSLSFSQYWGI